MYLYVEIYEYHSEILNYTSKFEQLLLFLDSLHFDLCLSKDGQ